MPPEFTIGRVKSFDAKGWLVVQIIAICPVSHSNLAKLRGGLGYIVNVPFL